MSRTRNQSRQALWNTDSSPLPTRRSRVDDGDSSGSTTSIDQEEEEWSTKNDGGPIKQNHFGTKRGEGKVKENTGGDQRSDRRGKGRGRGSSRVRGKGSGQRGKREDVVVKREASSSERQIRIPRTRTRTRTRSASGPVEAPAPIDADKTHEANASTEDNEAGHEAELEEGEEVTTRKSGRARRLPTRFAPDADRTDGHRRSTAKAVEGKERKRSEAMGKLENAGGGLSRRMPKSESESPDPIGLYDIDFDIASNQSRPPPSKREENDQTKEVEDPIPENPSPEAPTCKGVLKRPHDGSSTTQPKRKKAVTIDETKNQVKQIRSIKLITSSTSTSSDKAHEGPPPPIKRTRNRGPNRYGIRARKGQNDQVPAIPPRRRRTIHENKKDLSSLLKTHLEQSEREKGGYEVSSDSDPDLKSDPSRSGTKKAKKANKEMNKVILNQQGNVVNDNTIFLLAMAASLSSSDGDSSSIDDPDSHSSPNVSTLKPKSEARSSAHPPLAIPTIDFTRHTTRPVPPIPARPMSILSPVRPRPPSRADELRARAEREIERELRARAKHEFKQQLRVGAERDSEHRLLPRPRTDLEQAELWSDFVGVMEYVWEQNNRPRLDQVKVFRASPSAIPQNQIQICRQSPKSPPVKGQSGPRPSAHREEIEEDTTPTGSPPTEPRMNLLAGPPLSAVEHEIQRPSLDFEKSCRRLAGIQLADRGMGMRLYLPPPDRVGNVPRL